MFTPQNEQTRNTSALPTTQRAANTNTTVAFRPKRFCISAEVVKRFGRNAITHRPKENVLHVLCRALIVFLLSIKLKTSLL